MRAAALLVVTAGTLGIVSPLRAEIPWQTSLRTAHEQAVAQGKLLLLHFYSDNCVYCDRLEEGAFQSPAVAQAITAHYVPVKIHAGQSPTLANTFRVTRWPTDVIVTPDGAVLSHSVSPQAPAAYTQLLAQHSAAAGRAPAALAGKPAAAPPAAMAQPVPAAPAASEPVAAQLAAAQPANALPAAVPATAPQASAAAALAVQPPQPQANPFAPPLAAAPAAAVTAPSPTAHSTVSAPATTEPPPRNGGFALPANFGGIPARTVGHREEGLDLAAPAQAPATSDHVMDGGLQLPTAGLDAPAADVAAQAATDAAAAADEVAQPQPPLAMDGYCPVSVVDRDTWTAGDPALGVIHLGQLYLFANAEAMKKFLADPVPYTPVMNGIDVVRFFEERRVVPGSREWGLKDPEFNRIFFFADEASMNHFYNAYQRYTRSAIEVTRQAALEANQVR